MVDDAELMAALELDDSLECVRTLAKGPAGTTELVRRRVPREGEPRLLVRKRMGWGVANEDAWRTLAGLHVPRLPRVRDVYRLPDALVVTYDYLEGSTLAHLVEKDGPLDVPTAARVATQLCEALAPLHVAGVVHRDVAPGNVVCAADGAHLIDLGIARRHVDGASRDTTRLGTWGFAAPEQYGFAQTDARSDVFSLGRLLSYMLTGVVPGSDERGLPREGNEPSELRPGRRSAPMIPEGLTAVIRKATAFEPSSRYQSVDELAAALAPWAVPTKDQDTARERTVGRVGSLFSAVRRLRGWRLVVAIALTLASLLAALVFIWSGVLLLTEPKLRTDPAGGVLLFMLAAYALAVGLYEPVCCLAWSGRYATDAERSPVSPEVVGAAGAPGDARTSPQESRALAKWHARTLLSQMGWHTLQLAIGFVAVVVLAAILAG